PHGASWHQTTRPITTSLQLPAKTPFAGEAVSAEKTTLTRLRVDVSPLDFHVCSRNAHAGGSVTLASLPVRASSSGAFRPSWDAQNQAPRHEALAAVLRCHLAGLPRRAGGCTLFPRTPDVQAPRDGCESDASFPFPGGSSRACSRQDAPPAAHA